VVAVLVALTRGGNLEDDPDGGCGKAEAVIGHVALRVSRDDEQIRDPRGALVDDVRVVPGSEVPAPQEVSQFLLQQEDDLAV
jgi:hypothetical protein